MEIHAGTPMYNMHEVKEDSTGWTITVKSIRVDKARMTELLDIMGHVSPEEFAFMLHMATGLKIGSRDSKEILTSYLRYTSKYDDHKKIIKDIALENESR